MLECLALVRAFPDIQVCNSWIRPGTCTSQLGQAGKCHGRGEGKASGTEQVHQHQGHNDENELLSWKLTSRSAFLSLSTRQEPGSEARDAARLKIQTSPRPPQPAGCWEGLCPPLALPTHCLPWMWADTGRSPAAAQWEMMPALLSYPSSSLHMGWCARLPARPIPREIQDSTVLRLPGL